jgi:hypothetical protein
VNSLRAYRDEIGTEPAILEEHLVRISHGSVRSMREDDAFVDEKASKEPVGTSAYNLLKEIHYTIH